MACLLDIPKTGCRGRLGSDWLADDGALSVSEEVIIEVFLSGLTCSCRVYMMKARLVRLSFQGNYSFKTHITDIVSGLLCPRMHFCSPPDRELTGLPRL